MSGDVHLDGDTPALALTTQEFARRVTMLPQSRPTPGGVTVADVVAYGRHPHRGRWLGKMLRELREANGITLKEAADHLRRAQSSMSRFESGFTPIGEPDVRELMNLYGVDGEHQRTAMLRLAEEIAKTGWWERYAKDITNTIDYVWLENRAERVRSYTPLVVSGLLQTRRYAETIIGAWHPDASKQQLERWISVRMRRQQILEGDKPTELVAILDEAALRRPVGGPDVMAEQFRHLRAAAERSNIEVRILPFAAGAYPNEASNVALLKLPDPFPEVAHVESAAGTILLERNDVTGLADLYRRMYSLCLSADDSVAFLATLEKARAVRLDHQQLQREQRGRLR